MPCHASGSGWVGAGRRQLSSQQPPAMRTRSICARHCGHAPRAAPCPLVPPSSPTPSHARAWLEQAPALAHAFLSKSALTQAAIDIAVLVSPERDSPEVAADRACYSHFRAICLTRLGFAVMHDGLWPAATAWRLLYHLDEAAADPSLSCMPPSDAAFMRFAGYALARRAGAGLGDCLRAGQRTLYGEGPGTTRHATSRCTRRRAEQLTHALPPALLHLSVAAVGALPDALAAHAAFTAAQARGPVDEVLTLMLRDNKRMLARDYMACEPFWRAAPLGEPSRAMRAALRTNGRLAMVRASPAGETGALACRGTHLTLAPTTQACPPPVCPIRRPVVRSADHPNCC